MRTITLRVIQYGRNTVSFPYQTRDIHTKPTKPQTVNPEGIQALRVRSLYLAETHSPPPRCNAMHIAIARGGGVSALRQVGQIS